MSIQKLENVNTVQTISIILQAHKAMLKAMYQKLPCLSGKKGETNLKSLELVEWEGPGKGWEGSQHAEPDRMGWKWVRQQGTIRERLEGAMQKSWRL
jgi:hypothetical protein